MNNKTRGMLEGMFLTTSLRQVAYKLFGIMRVKHERVTTYRFLTLTWLRNIIWL